MDVKGVKNRWAPIEGWRHFSFPDYKEGEDVLGADPHFPEVEASLMISRFWDVIARIDANICIAAQMLDSLRPALMSVRIGKPRSFANGAEEAIRCQENSCANGIKSYRGSTTTSRIRRKRRTAEAE